MIVAAHCGVKLTCPDLDHKVQNSTDVSSKAEVIRNSLRVYEYITAMIKEGYELEFKKDKKKVTIVPLPI